MAKAVEELLKRQLIVGGKPSKFTVNTNKIGAANINYDVVHAWLSLLDDYWNETLVHDRELNNYSIELVDEAYFTDDMFSDYEQHYVLAKATLTAELSNFMVEAQRRGIGAPTNQQVVELCAMGSAVPKLKRPTFSGKQEKWETFKESFTAMFKNDPTLMPNLKLQHLISCLEGEAARRIANFQISGANFDVAWQALCRRYDNSRLRLSTQLSLLVNIPAVAK